MADRVVQGNDMQESRSHGRRGCRNASGSVQCSCRARRGFRRVVRRIRTFIKTDFLFYMLRWPSRLGRQTHRVLSRNVGAPSSGISGDRGLDPRPQHPFLSWPFLDQPPPGRERPFISGGEASVGNHGKQTHPHHRDPALFPLLHPLHGPLAGRADVTGPSRRSQEQFVSLRISQPRRLSH